MHGWKIATNQLGGTFSKPATLVELEFQENIA